MNFNYNGREYNYPNSLKDITLAQRIAYEQQYGRDLIARAIEVNKLKDGFDREIETYLLETETAVKGFSFFTGISLEEVQANIEIGQIVAVYNASLALLLDQTKEINCIARPIDWDGSTWTISPPELLPDSKFVFNEFLTSKEIVRQLYSLGQGYWEALPFLCCIYLRKEGEPYTDDLAKEDGPRYQQMLNLPLDIALEVGFFLSDSMTLFSQTFLYSNAEELAKA